MAPSGHLSSAFLCARGSNGSVASTTAAAAPTNASAPVNCALAKVLLAFCTFHVLICSIQLSSARLRMTRTALFAIVQHIRFDTKRANPSCLRGSLISRLFAPGFSWSRAVRQVSSFGAQTQHLRPANDAPIPANPKLHQPAS